jgi:hypothetical protein
MGTGEVLLSVEGKIVDPVPVGGGRRIGCIPPAAWGGSNNPKIRRTATKGLLATTGPKIVDVVTPEPLVGQGDEVSWVAAHNVSAPAEIPTAIPTGIAFLAKGETGRVFPVVSACEGRAELPFLTCFWSDMGNTLFSVG